VSADPAEVAGGGGDRLQESTAPRADYPLPPGELGVARPGRHRDHLFPGRRLRIAPSFSTQEYAAVVAAAARIGLTPTGYCAEAALALAANSAPEPTTATTEADGAELGPAAVEALAAFQAELADARTAVVRVGTNLNQAVRAFNATGEAPPWLQHVAELSARTLTALDAAASAIHRRLR
jgi:hypothetical protein